MAIYIPIEKESEDERMVVYAYFEGVSEPNPEGPRKHRYVYRVIGRAGVDKESGEVVKLFDTRGEVPFECDFYFSRVERVLNKVAAAKSYPDQLDYRA